MKKKNIVIISILVISLGLGIALGACKSKKTTKNEISDPEPLTVPQYLELKTPLVSPGFSTTPTFTVRQVAAGDTIRLFKSSDCAEDALLGSGVVEAGQTTVDITLDSLPALGTYQIYANRTNMAGATSSCSSRLISYQLIGCPDGLWVPVEGNPDLGTDSFCVMVTEAKQGANNIPVAQYAGNPWVSISALSAKAACKSIPLEHGFCDLISNPQWMTVARDIEATAANWSGGEVGSGQLSRGQSDVSVFIEVADPEDPWNGTQDNLHQWQHKRTHTLSNGGVIWDFAGNLREWVDWETGGDTFSLGPTTCPTDYFDLYAMDCADLHPDDYLPGNPAGIDHNDYGAANYALGMVAGTAEAHRENGGAAMRSGRANHGGKAGIYYLILDSPPTYTANDSGFRCVCAVTGE